MKTKISAQQAREIFEIREGVLFNRINRGSNAKAGQPAGSVSNWGYIKVQALGRYYKAHHLVWLIERGVWAVELDHINGLRSDNRIENLREVSRQENMRNKRLTQGSASGVMGVVWNKALKKWRAVITVSRKNIYLGYFDDLESAVKAREEANRKYGFHENHGKEFA